MFSSFNAPPVFGGGNIETRRALVVINIQNDSLDTSAELLITKPHDFVERLKGVIPHFRTLGDIAWVRTEFESEPATSPKPSKPTELSASDPAVASTQLHDDQNPTEPQRVPDVVQDTNETQPMNETQPTNETQATNETQPMEVDDPPASRPRVAYYPTTRTKALLKKASSETRDEQRKSQLAHFEDDDDLDAYLSKPRKGQPPTLYCAGTHGAEIADDVKPLVDVASDMMITKHHYSAFDATPLLLSLRMRLVTDLYLCGCLSNVSIYASAADAVRHGFSVYVVEDCVGYRSEAKHLDAMRQMADVMGVCGIDSDELIVEAGGRAIPEAEVSMFSGPGIGGIDINAHDITPELEAPKLVKSTDASPSIELESPPVPEPGPDIMSFAITPLVGATLEEPPSKWPDVVVESTELRPPSELLLTVAQTDEAIPSISTDMSLDGSGTGRASALSVDPQIEYGEGDSRILPDCLPLSLSQDAFTILRSEVNWQIMRHRTGEVPRLVAVQGELDGDGNKPLYRHPADESPPLSSFSATIKRIRDEVQAQTQQPLNHALIQLYRDGQDNISEHSDKTLDITRGSNVINLSLGAQRVMTLRMKKSARAQGSPGAGSSRKVQRIPMPHNSIFLLGPRTNMRWLHGIRADKRMTKEKSEAELSFGGERISITFRSIATFTDATQSKIWGQGARSKRPDEAGNIFATSDTEMDSMVAAFGKENQQCDFDWDQVYGNGFDVVNLLASTPQLFLCNDAIANVRCIMSLVERGVSFQQTKESPTQAANRKSASGTKLTLALSSNDNPTFKDVDQDASEVVGDLAILFYLGQFYPTATPSDISSKQLQRLTTQVYSRATQADDLLFLWRELRGEKMTTSSRGTQRLRRSSSEDSTTPDITTSTLDEFRGDMEVWEDYASEAEYLGGDLYSLIDCAFWPVLHHIVENWDGWSEDTYPDLANYYRRVGAMESVIKALEMVCWQRTEDSRRDSVSPPTG